MQNNDFIAIAERLLRIPAAPYFEAAIASEVLSICAENELVVEKDRFGNLYVKLCRAARSRPFCMVAHLDHPAFRISKQINQRSWHADFRGGVPDQYFQPGTPLLLMPGRTEGRLVRKEGTSYIIQADIVCDQTPQFAVWDLPEFDLKGERLRARACDDLIGVASILTVLTRLNRSKARVNILGLLTRAEEVGFHGTLAAIEAKRLPKEAFIVSLETSREMPPAKIGAGVIIRVGDRASIFDSVGTRFLTELAGDLAKTDKNFRFQRALMSGGTCEATPFQEAGFQTVAVCVALGNYHNCGPSDRIAAEYINVSDALAMVQLLQDGASQLKNLQAFSGRLAGRLKRYSLEARKSLRASQMPLIPSRNSKAN